MKKAKKINIQKTVAISLLENDNKNSVIKKTLNQQLILFISKIIDCCF